MDEILRRDLLRYSFLYLVFDTVVRCIFLTEVIVYWYLISCMLLLNGEEF